MKQLNETFEDIEHKDLSDEKKRLGFKSWHDFIIFLNKFHKDNSKKK